MKAILVLIALFACSAQAAEITGKWKGTAEGPNGPLERTFIFKVDGTKLTGETESQTMGKSSLAEGKVEGNTVTGDTIQLSVDFAGGGQTVEYKLKRE